MSKDILEIWAKVSLIMVSFGSKDSSKALLAIVTARKT